MNALPSLNKKASAKSLTHLALHKSSPPPVPTPPPALTGVHSPPPINLYLNGTRSPEAVVSNPIAIRAPRTPARHCTLAPPSTAWLSGDWHVTHTTLAAWRRKRNILITYTELAPALSEPGSRSNSPAPRGMGRRNTSSPARSPPMRGPGTNNLTHYNSSEGGGLPRLSNSVRYQGRGAQLGMGGGEKLVRGIDVAEVGPDGTADGWAWRWKGKGLHAIAGASGGRWEVLGWGDEEPEPGSFPSGPRGRGRRKDANQWVVTFAEKTLFSPARVDVYSRLPTGLRRATLELIFAKLKEVNDDDVRRLASELGEVKVDIATKEAAF